ncbi:MAG: PolC-type DNA polymerase III [Erysipelotrichaceae bacterium]|nr:PolC-type DNA polymerase III [Erysipelotrichaceae bacterium]
MNEKLLNILTKINLRKAYFAYFENASFSSLSYNPQKKRYNIVISSLQPLLAPVYVETLNAFTKYLSSQDNEVTVSLSIKLEKENFDNKIVKDYITLYIDSKVKNPEEYSFLKEQSMAIKNNVVKITYSSALLEDFFNSLKGKLELFLHAAGFTYLSLEFIYIEPEEVTFDYEKDKEAYENLLSKFTEMKKQEAEAKQKDDSMRRYNIRPSFKNKTFTKVELDQIPKDIVDIEAEVKVFDIIAEGKSNKRFKINFTNYKTSYTGHIWVSKTNSKEAILSLLNKWIIIRGTLSYNQFDKEDSLEIYNFDVLDKTDPVRKDEEEIKRVELHAHTNMSAMDGICDVSDLITTACSFNHKAIAITDHVAVQSFPDAQRTQAKLKAKGKDIKIIYGIELNVAPRALTTITNPSSILLKDATYVFFDLETTGLSCVHDKIIEFGAVKVKNGEEIDRVDILIKPDRPLSKFTTNLTGISNEMLSDKPSIEQVLPQILAFIKDSVLIAHNASFDIGFLKQAIKGKLSNPTIDTLPLCRYLFQNEKRYTLGSLCRSKGIDYDEESAHRGDYDAEVLKDLYLDAILPQLLAIKNDITHEYLSTFQSHEVTRKMHPYHVNLLVKNMVGMKNLFKILSIANTDYFTAQALVPPHIINEHKEGLLIGSSCARGEIFELASTKSEEEVIEAMKWYDYIEIQPLDQYQILVDTEKVESMDKVKEILLFMIRCANKANKIICATGDLHYINEEQAIARDVFISTPAIGGGYHPLFDYKNRIEKYPIQEFKTTRQMLDAFSWLGEEKAFEYVVTNTNLIADQIEYCYPIKDRLYPPSIPDSDDQLRNKCYENAHKMYGDVLPEIVEKRLERELNCIIGNGYSIMYVIAAKCVEHSASEGFLVGSRGSVGSSFAATCANITEVNPLKPHYRCPSCRYSDFDIDETIYRSGFDLPDKPCPICGKPLIGDGHNIPFETFLGFNGDKVPDIDLNFSALNQADSHLFIREMFGKDHVFRAGTIACAASKTAFGYAKKYYENKGIEIRNAEAARIALMCEGVKRTTGQHPGGLIVIPSDMDVYDFTPVGHPADDIDSEWLTTHFAFEAIHDNVLKLDMLGHVDPTVIRMLQNLTGINPKDVPLNDPKVIAQFNGEDLRGNQKLTAAGLPEFGTQVARKMLIDTKPTSFADLTKISGLSHGTDVFFGNIRDLILDKKCTIKDCIGCRDDIMLMLMSYNVEPLKSFKIMEAVRKGKGLSEDDIKMLKEHDVPDWFIQACLKIKYLFPKAHAVAYCLMAVRIAWFKYYYPLEYYATYFTWRSDAYDIEAMVKGSKEIEKKFDDLNRKIANNEKLSVKENGLYTFYEIAIEMYQRGISFSNINLDKSLDIEFVVDKENNQIIPPFKVCDGIGENAASSVIEARVNGNFLSIDDLRKRTKLNDTNIKLLSRLGVLDNLQKTQQLTLF